MKVRLFLFRLLRLRVWLTELLRPRDLQVTLFWAGLVGFIGGLSSVLFRKCIHIVQWVFTHHQEDIAKAAISLPWEIRLMIPTLGGLIAGWVIHLGMRFTRGQSSTDYMEAIVVGDGVIRSRPSLVKSVSSLMTIASGGSIGREGPMVQLAAMLASWIGRHAHVSVPRLQLLVACGAAAGIASAYNAPIAGSLFVAEIILGSIAMESFGALVFSSVIAVLTIRQFFGSEPIFETPAFYLVSSWEMVVYLILGLLVGVTACGFLRLLRESERLFLSWNVPIYVRMVVGGFIVGLISIYSPHILGNGYSVVDSMLHEDWMWGALGMVLVCKLAATAATVGSGAVGGVFTPTLFIGAALGSLWGVPVHALWSGTTATPHAYALVGMGCFLAATTRAPLMAILMLFEMTLDYSIVLPLMLGCVTAYYTASSIEKGSIYAESLERKKLSQPEIPVSKKRVRDLIKLVPPTILETADFAEIAKCFVLNQYNYLYVVDSENRFRGVISLHDMKTHLNRSVIAQLVTAYDLMDGKFPVVTPETSVEETVAIFSRYDSEQLPVVERGPERKLLGSVSKTDLLLMLTFQSKHLENKDAP